MTIDELRTLADAICELDACKGCACEHMQPRISQLIDDLFNIIMAAAGPDVGLIFDQSEEVTEEQFIALAERMACYGGRNDD